MIFGQVFHQKHHVQEYFGYSARFDETKNCCGCDCIHTGLCKYRISILSNRIDSNLGNLRDLENYFELESLFLQLNTKLYSSVFILDKEFIELYNITLNTYECLINK